MKNTNKKSFPNDFFSMINENEFESKFQKEREFNYRRENLKDEIPYLNYQNLNKIKKFVPPKIDIDCLNENSPTSNSTPTIQENPTFLFNQKHIHNNLINDNKNFQFNNNNNYSNEKLNCNNFSFYNENNDENDMDYLFKETAHFNMDNVNNNESINQFSENKKIKYNECNSTKINKNIKYNLIEEFPQKNKIKTPKNNQLKRPSSQRQKVINNNTNNNNNYNHNYRQKNNHTNYNNFNNNYKNEKDKKIDNISTHKKVEKELNNLIHSLPTEFYKDTIIKNKFSEIMKNIDDIKQVINKKFLKKNNNQKGNEKVILKDKKIHKSNLIQPRK